MQEGDPQSSSTPRAPHAWRRQAEAFALAATTGGLFVAGSAFSRHDADGVFGAQALPKNASAIAPFGDGWLCFARGDKAIHNLGDKPLKLASGAAIGAFGASASEFVVGRENVLELWGDEGERWRHTGGPWNDVAVGGDHVLAVDAEGALLFLSKDDGEPLGALRLASVEPASTWRIAFVGRAEAVLALGDWLVWIDLKTRKVARRVRTRAKVNAIAADQELVVAGCEDGWIQAFLSTTGEPRGAFVAHERAIYCVALAADRVYTADGKEVCAFERSILGVVAKVAEPITALAASADVVAFADKKGVMKITKEGRELSSLPLGEAALSVQLLAQETVVAATSRMVISAKRPWNAPRPVVLKSPATAIAADEAYVFAGNKAGSIDVFDLERGGYITSYALTDADVSALVRLPGAGLVVGTGALDGRLFVVDVAEAKVLHRLEIHDEAFGVTCLAADRRGRIVASGSDDGTIALVDPAKGRKLVTIRVPETPCSIAFDPTGRRIACAFTDGTAAIVTLGPKGASIADLGLRAATRVVWSGEVPTIGYRDGRVEPLSSGAPHSLGTQS